MMSGQAPSCNIFLLLQFKQIKILNIQLQDPCFPTFHSSAKPTNEIEKSSQNLTNIK